jgi:hypothetical protein
MKARFAGLFGPLRQRLAGSREVLTGTGTCHAQLASQEKFRLSQQIAMLVNVPARLVVFSRNPCTHDRRESPTTGCSFRA